MGEVGFGSGEKLIRKTVTQVDGKLAHFVGEHVGQHPFRLGDIKVPTTQNNFPRTSCFAVEESRIVFSMYLSLPRSSGSTSKKCSVG